MLYIYVYTTRVYTHIVYIHIHTRHTIYTHEYDMYTHASILVVEGSSADVRSFVGWQSSCAAAQNWEKTSGKTHDFWMVQTVVSCRFFGALKTIH